MPAPKAKQKKGIENKETFPTPSSDSVSESISGNSEEEKEKTAQHQRNISGL